jgi:ankyrin repeat protein
VRLLAEHGVDTRRPFADGSSPAVLAVTSGHAELVAELSPPGSPPLELEPAAAFVGAALAADGPRVAELRRGHPDVADEVRAERPGLVVWAAVAGQPGSVELLVAAGFDVNAKGRSDTPANGAWETALHHAAAVGNLELARTLLRLGADPDIRDHRFDAPALGWARQFGQAALVELLEPITAGDAGVE